MQVRPSREGLAQRRDSSLQDQAEGSAHQTLHIRQPLRYDTMEISGSAELSPPEAIPSQKERQF